MAGYNKVVMVGNLTRDPELKPVGQQSVCKFNIASNRQYKNKNTGALSQEVCFIDVEVWGSQADSCKMYLQKGKSVLVEGRIKLDSWKDSDGNPRSKHSISAERVIFLGSSANNKESTSNNLEESDNLNYQETVKASRGFGNKKKTDSFEDSQINFENNSPFQEDELPF